MPRGDKRKYTDKQKRQAEHIEEGYERRGVPEDEAEGRAWATVNKSSGGGKKSGSGRGKKTNKSPMQKGGRKGGTARKSANGRKNSGGRTRKASSSRQTGTKRGAANAGRTTAAKRKSSSRKP